MESIQNSDNINEIRELISQLNLASKAYYQETKEIMANFEYDKLYDRLLELEEKTGLVFSNSPTQKVGYEILSSLPKENHKYPMLSLDKTKEIEELSRWLGMQDGLLSWKLDGLTVVLTYEGGRLSKALTRGNGLIGEIITSNARTFVNLPLTIGYKGTLVLRGEAVIKYSDFREINQSFPEGEVIYKNPRNLCSGSVRQLNSQITAKRNVNFMAFGLVEAEGVDFKGRRKNQLEWLEDQGFSVVEYKEVKKDNLQLTLKEFQREIVENDLPSDGLVLTFDDIEYGRRLGSTSKFPRDAIAFKWEDQLAETTLTQILWSPSRTGLINPIAIFEPVDLEGTTVSRASVHNISIMKALQLGVGDKLMVYKANMIIPQIGENLTRSGPEEIPKFCPVCSHEVKLKNNEGVETLHCINEKCPAKEIKSFTLLVSRDGLNVEGLSESTLEKFIDEGLVKEPAEIFNLKEHKEEIVAMDGFGIRSFEKLIKAIEKARNTSPERLLYAIGVPNIGVAVAKLIVRGAGGKWSNIETMTESQLMSIDGVGPILAKNFVDYFKDVDKKGKRERLLKELVLNEVEEKRESFLEGNTFVITGSLNYYDNRDELKDLIEKSGGKVAGSVSSKTNFLINNDVTSNSGKNKKAKELNIKIIDEENIKSCLENKTAPEK